MTFDEWAMLLIRLAAVGVWIDLFHRAVRDHWRPTYTARVITVGCLLLVLACFVLGALVPSGVVAAMTARVLYTAAATVCLIGGTTITLTYREDEER